MTTEPEYTTQPMLLPEGLPLLRCRVTMRLLEDAALPAFKGALLRGGFGYAFQRAACPQTCWGARRALYHAHAVPLSLGV